MSEPLILENPEPSRRAVLGRAVAGLIVGLVTAGLEGSFAPFRTRRYAVARAVPPRQTAELRRAAPVRWNRQSQIVVDMSDPATAGQEGTVLWARYGNKQLATHHEVARRNYIPASLQKCYTQLVAADLCELDNIYGQLTEQGVPYEAAGARPLLTMDTRFEITPTAASLNSRHYTTAGETVTVADLIRAMDEHSCNAAAEALAHGCGAILLKAELVKHDAEGLFPQLPGAEHRAFNIWAQMQAHARYGLSPQFKVINAHGLPGYETVTNIGLARDWIETQPERHWTAKKTSARNKLPHFGLKSDSDPLAGIDSLPPESGICATPKANNCWGLLDGAIIMSQLKLRHPDLVRKFKDEAGRVAPKTARCKSARVKTGTSNNAGGNLHGIADLELSSDSCELYVLVAGQPRRGDKYLGKVINYERRYPAFAEALDVVSQLRRNLQALRPAPAATNDMTPSPAATPLPTPLPAPAPAAASSLQLSRRQLFGAARPA